MLLECLLVLMYVTENSLDINTYFEYSCIIDILTFTVSEDLWRFLKIHLKSVNLFQDWDEVFNLTSYHKELFSSMSINSWLWVFWKSFWLQVLLETKVHREYLQNVTCLRERTETVKTHSAFFNFFHKTCYFEPFLKLSTVFKLAYMIWIYYRNQWFL